MAEDLLKKAEELSLAENTVRTRVANLMEQGVLENTGAVDAIAVPVKAVTGRYNLFVTVILVAGVVWGIRKKSAWMIITFIGRYLLWFLIGGLVTYNVMN